MATNTKKRDGFNQMIVDYEVRKIDRLITKSISTFEAFRVAWNGVVANKEKIMEKWITSLQTERR
ncbi:MAG: hypothetical protein K2I03_13870 [Lachnospiraceae bacterium]|nr:hypothetical protein [Lachnospiraceae bacterium]